MNPNTPNNTDDQNDLIRNGPLPFGNDESKSKDETSMSMPFGDTPKIEMNITPPAVGPMGDTKTTVITETSNNPDGTSPKKKMDMRIVVGALAIVGFIVAGGIVALQSSGTFLSETRDDRSRAGGIACGGGECNDGFTYGQDCSAPQTSCVQRNNEACASHGGHKSGGGPITCGGGTTTAPTSSGGGGTPTCQSGSHKECVGKPIGPLSISGTPGECFKNGGTNAAPVCGWRFTTVECVQSGPRGNPPKPCCSGILRPNGECAAPGENAPTATTTQAATPTCSRQDNPSLAANYETCKKASGATSRQCKVGYNYTVDGSTTTCVAASGTKTTCDNNVAIGNTACNNTLSPTKEFVCRNPNGSPTGINGGPNDMWSSQNCPSGYTCTQGSCKPTSSNQVVIKQCNPQQSTSACSTTGKRVGDNCTGATGKCNSTGLISSVVSGGGNTVTEQHSCVCSTTGTGGPTATAAPIGGGQCAGVLQSCDTTPCCGGQNLVCQGSTGNRKCQQTGTGGSGDSWCGAGGGASSGAACNMWYGFKCSKLTNGQCLENPGGPYSSESQARSYAGNACGQVDQVCNSASGDRAGQLCGGFEVINNSCGAGGGTPIVTKTPTSAPVMCTAVKLWYRDGTEWKTVSFADAKTKIKVGDAVRISSTGKGRAFTKARFRIKVGTAAYGTWQETTTKDNGEFYINYTIPSAGNFGVQSQLM